MLDRKLTCFAQQSGAGNEKSRDILVKPHKSAPFFQKVNLTILAVPDFHEENKLLFLRNKFVAEGKRHSYSDGTEIESTSHPLSLEIGTRVK